MLLLVNAHRQMEIIIIFFLCKKETIHIKCFDDELN